MGTSFRYSFPFLLSLLLVLLTSSPVSSGARLPDSMGLGWLIPLLFCRWVATTLWESQSGPSGDWHDPIRRSLAMLLTFVLKLRGRTMRVSLKLNITIGSNDTD